MPITGLEVIDLNICGTSSGHKTIVLGSSSHRITHIILVFTVRYQQVCVHAYTHIHTHTLIIWKYQKYWRILLVTVIFAAFSRLPFFSVLGIKHRTLYVVIKHSCTERPP